MLETFRIALGYSATKQLDLKDGIGYQCHRVADANFFAAVTKNLLSTPPMPTMLADSQSMAPMTIERPKPKFSQHRNRNFGRYRNR